MRIEVLYFDGCTNHERLLPRLRQLLDRAGVSDEIRLVRVESSEAAERERFLGSPTLRVDGADVEPGASERTDYGFKCRLYRTGSGVAGVPADEWVLAALRAAAGGEVVVAVLRIEEQAASDFEAVASGSWVSKRLAGLPEPERRLHRRILRSMAGGNEVAASDLAGWASEEGLNTNSALEALAGRDLALRDPGTGGISVAYPFSARPTAHRVSFADGLDVFAMCAIDALGVPFMVGEAVEVRSTDPATGAQIEVSLDASGASDSRPPDTVVVLGCANTDASSSHSANGLCPHTNFAVSPASGQAQLDVLTGCAGVVLSMSKAIAAGREIFGALLADHQEVAHAGTDRA